MMPTFVKSLVPEAFGDTLRYDAPPGSYGAVDLGLGQDGSSSADYAAAKIILLGSSDESYPYYVFTITRHMFLLKTESIPPLLGQLFQAIDFNRLAGPALRAQPNLEAKLGVFLMIMGFFYNRDLLQIDQADALIKSAAESLNELLLEMLASGIASDAGGEADEDAARKANDLVGLVRQFPSAVERYYKVMMDREDNCDVLAGRLNHFVEQLKGTLLYEAMLVSIQQGDYYCKWKYHENSNFIRRGGFKQPPQLEALMRHDYKGALFTVAGFPACKKYFSDRLTKQGYGGGLLTYLQRAIFKDDLSELYDFLEGVIPEGFIDNLDGNDPLFKIKERVTLARQVALQAAEKAAEQDKKTQMLIENAMKQALSPVMVTMEKAGAMLGIMANALGNMERRMESLEKRVGALVGSPRMPGFFPPGPDHTPSSSSVGSVPAPAPAPEEGDSGLKRY